MAEKAENAQDKLRLKRLKLAEMQTDVQIKGERQRMQNAEIARLKA